VEQGNDSDALYEEIGRLKVELDCLKKSRHARLRTAALVNGSPGDQCATAMRVAGRQPLGLYYESVGESEQNLVLMRLLDEQYTRTPFYGSRRMTDAGNRGHEVNRKRSRD